MKRCASNLSADIMIQGMPGSRGCACFDDIAWDGFCQSDQMELRPHSKRSGDHITLGDNNKEHGSELTTISSETGDRASGYFYQGREQETFFNLSNRRNKMPRKDSWSNAPTDVYYSSSDINFMKNASSLAFDNHRSNKGFMNSNTDSHDNDICVNDKSNALDGNSFTYPLAGVTQTGSNLHLSGISENKDASDFLCSSWPEIGNFEDVDWMFRNCDSTFGITASSEDELDWFSSADDVRLSGTLLKSDLKSPSAETNVVENISENDNSSKGYTIDTSAFTSASCGRRDDSWTSENSSSCISFALGQPNTDGTDGCMLGEQIDDHIKRFNRENQSVGESNKEHNFGNAGFYHVSSLSNESMDLPSGHDYQDFRSVNLQPQQLAPGHSSNQISSMHSDDTRLSDLASVNPIPYTVNSEPNDVTLLSRSQSSYAQSMVNSQDRPVQGVSVPGYEEREKLHNQEGIRCYVANSLKDGSVMVQGSICDSGSIEKLECHSDGGGVSLVVPSESGLAEIQKSSTSSSSLDDISLEAASFNQLQLVKERLDSGTKLCIRDSLYRLARSAELRHNYDQNGSYEDESQGRMAERRNEFAAFADIETDTNPLDRSIAHLLFHKPQDSFAVPALASQLV